MDYNYANNNPTNYTDPSGHISTRVTGCDDGYRGSCADLYAWDTYQTYEAETPDVKRQDLLFGRMFRGSGKNGAWTNKDWEYYYSNRNDLWAHPNKWINPDPQKGWDAFALHVKRLSSYYGPDQKDEFVRDFALAFGGIPYYESTYQAAIDAQHGPAVYNGSFRSYLNEGNNGLQTRYVDSLAPKDNQSHHYAGLFFLSYFYGEGLTDITNLGRDWDNPGDINLGTDAATDATVIRFVSDFSELSDYISAYGNP